MSRFDEIFEKKYEFRLAKRSDIDAIMRYIDEAWKKGHILSKDRELFEYEFCDGEEVHFLLAIDKETGEIEGLDGYYRTSARKKDFDVWGSMWSVRKDHKNLPMLGIAIANQYFRQVGFRYELGVGVNEKTATPLHQQHFQVATGVLNHFYVLRKQDEYRIAVVNDYFDFVPFEKHDCLKLVHFYSINEVEKCFDFDEKITTYPFKDAWYINHRFFQHPVYHYDIYGIMRENTALALIVLKKTEINGHSAVGIVDYLGDIQAFKYVGNQLMEILDTDVEFLDFFCYGYDEEEIKKAGFRLMTKEDTNIIPSHFEPYEAKNITYWFNSDAKENFVICKADADQDRPNIV